MTFLCHICGCEYEWKMFFNNHMRAVHKITVDRVSMPNLKDKHKNFLKIYFQTICNSPSLEEVKDLARFLIVEKESVYWWFFNERRKQKRSIKEQKRCKVMTDETGYKVKPRTKPMISIESIFKSRNKKSNAV